MHLLTVILLQVETNQNANPEDSKFAFGVILLVLTIGIIFSPGMALLGMIKNKNPQKLDTGQLWTFAIFSSLILYVVLLACISFNSTKSFDEDIELATICYSLVCITITAIVLLCAFGFKLLFHRKLLYWFFPVFYRDEPTASPKDSVTES